MKKNKSKDAVVVCRMAAPRRLDNAFVKSLDWPAGEEFIRIIFKAPAALAKLIPSTISSRYMVRLGCYSTGKGLRAPAKTPAAAGIEARPPENFAEHMKVHKQARSFFMKTWGSRLTAGLKTSFGDFEKKNLAKTNSLIIFKKGKPAGIYSLFKMEQEGKPYDLVAWHNHLPGLTPAERRGAQGLAIAWLAKNAKRRLAVGLDGFDKVSLDFFSGLGFVVTRVGLTRLP